MGMLLENAKVVGAGKEIEFPGGMAHLRVEGTFDSVNFDLEYRSSEARSWTLFEESAEPETHTITARAVANFLAPAGQFRGNLTAAGASAVISAEMLRIDRS